MDTAINRILIYHKINGYMLALNTPENESFVLMSFGMINTLKDLVDKGVEIFKLFQYRDGMSLQERQLIYETDIDYLELRLKDIFENSTDELKGEFDLSDESLKKTLGKYQPV